MITRYVIAGLCQTAAARYASVPTAKGLHSADRGSLRPPLCEMSKYVAVDMNRPTAPHLCRPPGGGGAATFCTPPSCRDLRILIPDIVHHCPPFISKYRMKGDHSSARTFHWVVVRRRQVHMEIRRRSQEHGALLTGPLPFGRDRSRSSVKSATLPPGRHLAGRPQPQHD